MVLHLCVLWKWASLPWIITGNKGTKKNNALADRQAFTSGNLAEYLEGGGMYEKVMIRSGWDPGVTRPGSAPSLCTLPTPDSCYSHSPPPLQGGTLKANVLELAQAQLSFLPDPEAENHCHPNNVIWRSCPSGLPKTRHIGRVLSGPLSLALVPTKATEKLPPTQPWRERPKVWRS